MIVSVNIPKETIVNIFNKVAGYVNSDEVKQITNTILDERSIIVVLISHKDNPYEYEVCIDTDEGSCYLPSTDLNQAILAVYQSLTTMTPDLSKSIETATALVDVVDINITDNFNDIMTSIIYVMVTSTRFYKSLVSKSLSIENFRVITEFNSAIIEFTMTFYQGTDTFHIYVSNNNYDYSDWIKGIKSILFSNDPFDNTFIDLLVSIEQSMTNYINALLTRFNNLLEYDRRNVAASNVRLCVVKGVSRYLKLSHDTSDGLWSYSYDN